MGGLCSRSCSENDTPCGGPLYISQRLCHESGLVYQPHEPKVSKNTTSQVPESNYNKQMEEPFLFSEKVVSYRKTSDDLYDGIPHLSRSFSNKSQAVNTRQASVTKVSEVGSLLGKAGTVSFEKAVEVLDTLSSGMTSLTLNSGFTSVATRGNRISILAFEVANTIVKGSNLMQSLSKENIKHLKEAIIPSEGVQNLISTDKNELLRIAALDKREEFQVFSGEVVRFGNRCRDPQWHNLDRCFHKLDSNLANAKQFKENAVSVMRHLMDLVQVTAELYHEMHALDRFQQEYQHKIQEDEKSTASHGAGDSLAIIRAELKSQKKHVNNLKKKSLWSRVLEEVIEKLVDIVHFMILEIDEVFGIPDGDESANHADNDKRKLGSAGLSLHYANLIIQIDNLVTRTSSVPSNTRDALYQALTPTMKSALRVKLQSFKPKKELTAYQIRAEMEKTLHWLVPMATNTTKTHHGFGWVGEWANTGSDMNRKPGGRSELLKIETLHHANKDKTETHIVDLLVWLHHLLGQSRAATSNKSPIRLVQPKKLPSPTQKPKSPPTLTVEDREMIRCMSTKQVTAGRSKSQEFATRENRSKKHQRLCKSSDHSPSSESKRDGSFSKRAPTTVIDFDIGRMKALDVIDRVDTLRAL